MVLDCGVPRMKLPTWAVYKHLDLDERERIHLRWCKLMGKDPNSEDDVNEFFDLVDAVPEPDANAPPKSSSPAITSTGRPRGRPRKVQE